MISCRTRGLVLSVGDHGESDKIVTFFSPDIGRATGIAKGAKRSKKRFVNKLEVSSLLQIMYRPARKDGLLFLQEAELENAFLSLRQRYDRYIAAMFAGELALRFTRELDPDPPIFDLLLWAMQALDTGRDPLEVTALFHLRILGAAGYEPLLGSCGFCSRPVQTTLSYCLHAGSGSLVCSHCRDEQRGSLFAVSIQTLKFLHHAQRIELESLGRLRLPQKNILETLTILYRYTQHLLQHDIISWRQLMALAAPPTGSGTAGKSLQDASATGR